MQDENRYEYTVKTCNSDDIQALEDILNQMAGEGWELYSLNEAENEEGEFIYMCIFSREADVYGFSEEQIVDIGDFKTTMKKLLHRRNDLYDECRFLQHQIREKSEQISQIKCSLDEESGEIDRESLNREISEKINELNSLKSKFSSLVSPSNMYSRISQELLTIVVSEELSELIDNEKDGDLIAETVRLRQKLTDTYGYVIPRIQFIASEEMEENEYKIKVRNLCAMTGVVYPGYRRFFPGQSNLQDMPENAVQDVDAITGQNVFWLEEAQTKDFWDKGMTPSQVVVSNLEYVAHKYVDEIMSYEDILNYIALLGDKNAFLADDLSLSEIGLSDLKFIFSNLIKEKVSVKDTLFIFEKLNDLSSLGFENDKLLEELRILLRRQICSYIADENNTIYTITLPAKYKKIVEGLGKTESDKNRLKNNDNMEKLIKYIAKTIKNSEYSVSTAVIVVETRHRKQLADLSIPDLPNIHVLSEDEIAEEFNIQEL